MKRKKIFFQTDFSLRKTGFARNAKCLLNFLYKTGKYDIVHYCCSEHVGNPDLLRTPWKSRGCLPNSQQEIEHLNRDPNLARLASYGNYLIDAAITEEKPDVYIAAQDIWGVDFAIDKKWFNKITSVIWTTLDSLPLLPSAVEKAKKIPNYWIWSDFATKELHRLGNPHVQTMHGLIDDSYFKRLKDDDRKKLRQLFNIPENAFVIGFVFRNQLRKSVPNLLEGYAIWKRQNPEIKNTFLLLHTHFSEGWNIHRLADEYKIDKKEILTTYICLNCNNYEVKAFDGQHKDCRFCGVKGSSPTNENQRGTGQITTHIMCGVTESQLNEVYNLMDVYCHPFTSGGQEVPIQEAKLTELITLVTNYSCGEEMCQDGAGSLILDWAEYREHQTEFRKASTLPSSIAKQINKVYRMDKFKRAEIGKQARQWTLDNFSVKSVGEKIEKFLDNCPTTNYDFNLAEELKNPNAQVQYIENETEWLQKLYKEILKMDVDATNDGLIYWLNELKKGLARNEIEKYFREVAIKENQNNQKVDFSKLLDENDEGKRIVYVMPESIGDVFLSTSLFASLRRIYPNYNLYVATKPENFEILEGNPHIHKVIPYVPEMDSQPWLEGIGGHKGYFEIAFLPYAGTQKFLDYLHNAKDIIEFPIETEVCFASH